MKKSRMARLEPGKQRGHLALESFNGLRLQNPRAPLLDQFAPVRAIESGVEVLPLHQAIDFAENLFANILRDGHGFDPGNLIGESPYPSRVNPAQ